MFRLFEYSKIVFIISFAIVDLPLAVCPEMPIAQERVISPDKNIASFETKLSEIKIKIESLDSISFLNIFFNFFSIISNRENSLSEVLFLLAKI